MTHLGGLSVCLVGMHYAPETSGNAPYTTAMAQALTEAGANVHVITGIPHYPQWKIADAKYRSGRYWHEIVDGVRITRCRHHVPSHAALVGRARMEASFYWRASSVLQRDSSSVIIAVTPTLSALAATIAHRRGRPLGVLVQDLTGKAACESGAAGSGIGGLIGMAEYSMLRRCDQVGVITARFGDVLVSNGVHPERIWQLSNFSHIKPVSVDSLAARARLGWPQDRFTVVHTGNMGRKQGLETVVEAARISYRRGADVDFVLVGDGNQRRVLEQLGAGLPNLRFVPPLDAELYPYALAAADVLLLSEAAGVKEMSLPSKLTSYTAASRPVLASIEASGITGEELSRYGAASLTAAGDAVDLLRGLTELRDAPAMARAVVRGGQDLYRARYGREGAYARYVDFAEGLARVEARKRATATNAQGGRG